MLYQIEHFIKMRKTHGKTNTPEYRAWKDMKRRCLCPSFKSYPYYGGRGITIHERYLSFENFYADLGPRPEGFSLDRINNNKNYEPGNLRWVNHNEQMLNRRGWGKLAKGVVLQNGRYIAKFRNTHIGIFDTEQEASEAYKNVALLRVIPKKMTTTERARFASQKRWKKSHLA